MVIQPILETLNCGSGMILSTSVQNHSERTAYLALRIGVHLA